jgi:uncharacterized protein (TIGR03435 family)
MKRSAALAVLLTGAAVAQPSNPSLEVASVRKHVSTGALGGSRFTHGVSVSGSRVPVVACSLYQIVLEAYNLKPYQLSGGPDWARGSDSLDFDISAKAEGDAALTREQARLILQAVLADRFQLKVHRETRELPVYTLAVGKNGSKMKESAPDAEFDPSIDFGPSGRRISNPKSTMEQLVGFLSSQTGRPVLDKTGLTGFHSYVLDWNSYNDPQLAVSVPRDPTASDLSIFTAVQEQLGPKPSRLRHPWKCWSSTMRRSLRRIRLRRAIKGGAWSTQP